MKSLVAKSFMVWEKAKQWFEPPVFPNDEDKTRKAWVLSALLTSFLKITIPIILAVIFIAVQKLGTSILSFAILVIVFLSNWLLQKGNIQASSRIYVFGMWSVFVILYILGGRTNSSATNLLIAAIVIAGLLLSRAGAFLLTLLSGCIVFGMAVLETNGIPLVVIFPGLPLPSWVTWSISVFLVLEPINLVIQSVIRSSETLRESEERLKFVLEGSQLGYWDWNIKTGNVQRNEHWAQMLGYTLEEIEFTVTQWTDLHHPEDRDRAWKSIQDHLEGRTQEHKMEYRMLTKSGQYKWILDQARIVERDPQGNPLRMSGTHTDITYKKEMEQREQEERHLAEALSDNAAALNSTLDFEDVLDRIMENVGKVVPHDSVGIIMLDETGQIASVTRYYDNRNQQFGQKDIQFSIIQTRNLREIQASGAPVIVQDTLDYEGWANAPEGDWIRSALAAPIKIKDKIIGFLSLSRAEPNGYSQNDAERLKAFVNYAGIAIENARLYEEVQRLALTDPLTGTYNRSFFEAELLRLEHSREYPVSIIVGDLDNMKIVNDTLGHMAGDDILKNAAKILREVFRADEILARIGGDEFAILLPHTDDTALMEILSRLQKNIAKYNASNPQPPVLLSLGAATSHKGKLVEAFKTADSNMYEEKRRHKTLGK